MTGYVIGPSGVLPPPPVGGVFAIDGAAHAVTPSSQTTLAVNLTTTQTNEYIIVCTWSNAASDIVSVSSTALGALTHIGSGGIASVWIDLWAKFSSGVLTSDTITITQGAAAFCVVDAFGVSGSGQTSLVWDAGSPVTNSAGVSDPTSITTASANTMVIATFRQGGTPSPTAGSGFTQISGADYLLTEYKILSSAQTLSCTQTVGVGDSNGAVVVAIVHV